MTSKRNAFSLVELSIVLIIIGLLVASVTSGSKLIKQAKLNKVIREVTELDNAVKTFVLTYDAWPGDMNNAHDFWGSDCDSTASNCNGDNDGQIDYDDADTVAGEAFRGLQHLYLAGLTGFNASGTATAGAGVVGTNIMTSTFKDSGYIILYDIRDYVDTAPSTDVTYNINKNVISLGSATSITTDYDYGAGGSFLPADLYSIDKKIDDAKPLSGNVWGSDLAAGATCNTSATVYDLDGTTKTCPATFVLGVYK